MLLRGKVPIDVAGYGYGYGCGYGYGDGCSDGDGYGSGNNICKVTNHTKVTITTEKLKQLYACIPGIKKFQKHFPKGATWPDDVAKANKLGLSWHVTWLTKKLGLLIATEGGNYGL